MVGGEPTFRGTQILVHLVASLLREGATPAQIKESYPRLTHQMIWLAPSYAVAYPLQGPSPKPTFPAIPPKRIGPQGATNLRSRKALGLCVPHGTVAQS